MKQIQQNDLLFCLQGYHRILLQCHSERCLQPLYHGKNTELLPPLHNSDRCWTCWYFEKNHGLIFHSPALLCFSEMEVHLKRNQYNTLYENVLILWKYILKYLEGVSWSLQFIFKRFSIKTSVCIYLKLTIVKYKWRKYHSSYDSTTQDIWNFS